MRASTLKKTLKALYQTRRTVCIEGAPGGGKTTIVEQVARELGVPCVIRHMPTMLVEDFGVLYPKAGTDELSYRIPEWFPVEGKAPEDGILMFDDRNQAGADLQKVLANICQARELHGVKMPKGWMVVSTGNRQSDRAGANKVLGHLRNRETVLSLDTNVDDWTDWALCNDQPTELIGFIQFRPGLLHDYKADRDCNPTPRSWAEGVAAQMPFLDATNEHEAYAGAVGEGAASEFLGFLRVYRDLPDIDAVLRKPETAAVPREPITLYALTGALAARVTPQTYGALMTYMERLPGEFAVLAMTYLARRSEKDFIENPLFTQWIIKNAHLMPGGA